MAATAFELFFCSSHSMHSSPFSSPAFCNQAPLLASNVQHVKPGFDAGAASVMTVQIALQRLFDEIADAALKSVVVGALPVDFPLHSLATQISLCSLVRRGEGPDSAAAVAMMTQILLALSSPLSIPQHRVVQQEKNKLCLRASMLHPQLTQPALARCRRHIKRE